MSLTSAPFLRDDASPLLSARLAELVQYFQAPLMGQLTDEQRALCLAIMRRLVLRLAREIDASLDADSLWQYWLKVGVPANKELAALCFSRCEEHRWRRLSHHAGDAQGDPSRSIKAPSQDYARSAIYAEWPDVAEAYLQLQIIDRGRFDDFGYPEVSLEDVPDEIYRHLLNEVARWRLSAVSRDRQSSAGLGEAVRRAWAKHKDVSRRDITCTANEFHTKLLDVGQLHEAANDALERHDWLAFTAICAASCGLRYDEMLLDLVAKGSVRRFQVLDVMGLSADQCGPLAASASRLARHDLKMSIRA